MVRAAADACLPASPENGQVGSFDKVLSLNVSHRLWGDIQNMILLSNYPCQLVLANVFIEKLCRDLRPTQALVGSGAGTEAVLALPSRTGRRRVACLPGEAEMPTKEGLAYGQINKVEIQRRQ